MAGMDIATGALSAHDSSGATGNVLHPIDASATPGVQLPTATVGQLDGPTVAALDAAALFASVQGEALAECHAAMTAGMAAEGDRRDGYQREMLPIGSSPYQMGPLPVVPEDAVAPSNGFLYPEGGLQPTPTGTWDSYHGDEPLPQG